MQIAQYSYSREAGFHPALPAASQDDLCWLFYAPALAGDSALFASVRAAYPKALLLGASTAGEIADVIVSDDTAVLTTVQFSTTKVQAVCATLETSKSYQVGRHLAEQIEHTGLRHAFILSDGLAVNGSDLARGLAEGLPHGVNVTGGLAADGDRFVTTSIIAHGEPRSNQAVLAGLYGSNIHVGHGSLGGWDPFGPERHITRSEGSVLYELDGTSALELYKKYLGPQAADLPASALLFPLSLRDGSGKRVVRTILGIDENEGSMTFAGDMPEGSYAQLMTANFDRLIDGASTAAESAAQFTDHAELAILVSCVGRKLVLQQRIEDEVEAVREVLPDAVLTGFYSYGEVSPVVKGAPCALHNQTMTITTLREDH